MASDERVAVALYVYLKVFHRLVYQRDDLIHWEPQ